jgi:hypothetical protein
MNRRQLLRRMGTLAGLAVVSPSVSLAAFFKTLPQIPRIVPNDEHDEINLFIGFGLLSRVIIHRDEGKLLFDEILNSRDRLASAGGNLPRIRIHDDVNLPTEGYAIHVYGTRVFTGTALPDLAKGLFQRLPEGDLQQEQAIATELANIAVQHQYLWPHEERIERPQHCRKAEV